MQKLNIFSGIYKYSFKENKGKSYIGSSIYLRNRNSNHLSALKIGNHPNLDFQQAFNKYGLHNLVYEILEYVENDLFLNKTISKKEFATILFEKEQLYLNKYYAQEYINNSKDIRFFELLYNKSVLAASTISEKSTLIQKEIHKYTLKGEYIESYYNSSIASLCNKVDPSSIRRVCQSKSRKSAGNFIWKYEKVEKLPEYINTKFTAINQYDKNKVFIKRYESLIQAKLDTKIDVRKENNSKVKMQGGYYWLYDNEDFPLYKKKKIQKEFIEDCKIYLSTSHKYGERTVFVQNMIIKYDMKEKAIQNWIHRISKTNGFPKPKHKYAIDFTYNKHLNKEL